MIIGISIIWLVFAVLFFVLGLYHWNVAKMDIPPFKLSERPGKDMGSIKILGADIDQPVKDFVDDFNKHLTNQNELSKKQNRRSAYGYWLAALTALVSLFIVLKN
jgi:hypothetical protein